MDDREELNALRRLAELEAKATITTQPQQPVPGRGESALIGTGYGLDVAAAGLRQLAELLPAYKNLPQGPSAATLQQYGPRQLLDWLNQKMGMGALPSIEPSERAAAKQALAPLEKAYPVTMAFSEAAPMLAAKTPFGMAGMAALDYGTPLERAANAAFAYAGGKAGEFVGQKIGSMFGPRPSINPVRDATIQAARDAGYVFPPTQINPEGPGIINRLAEGFSGKIQTAQQAAIKNQAITNALARKAVGLDSGAPITREALAGIRSEAGKAYAAVADLGTLKASDAYGQELGQVIGPYIELKGQFPSQAIPKIDALIPDLTKPEMQSGAVVNLVKRLRKDGFANIKSVDPETQMLGRVQLGAQNALENMVETNLRDAGNTSLLDAYRAARTLIAKTHTVENALEESTGKVVAANVKRAFAKGAPLTDELATIGRTAQAFPKALQNINTSMPGVSPLDYAGGVLGGVISGQPLVAATPLLRPAVRSALLSGPYQRLLTSSGLSPSTAQLLGDVIGQVGARSGGTAGLLGLQYFR